MPDIHFAGTDLILEPTDVSEGLLADLLDCALPGPADEAVAYVMRTYEITGDGTDCAAFLRVYGAWEETDLLDHHTNLSRLVWLTACAFGGGEVAYFSGY